MLRTSKRSVTALLGVMVLVAALFTVACGDDDGGDATSVPPGTATAEATSTAGATTTEAPSGDGMEVNIVMTDIAYDVDEIDATAGEPLTVHLSNEGQLEHDFNIDDIAVSDVSASGDGTNMSGEEAPIHLHLKPGEEGAITFTPDEAGEYEFYCTQPGHEDAGMSGTLIVS